MRKLVTVFFTVGGPESPVPLAVQALAHLVRSCSAWIVATMSRIRPVRIGGRGSVERLGGGLPPVDDDGLSPLVQHGDAPDVDMFRLAL